MTASTPAASAFSLCVFCGARAGSNPAFAATAVRVGEWIGRHGGQLVYGGGRGGLMGVVADAALAAGARVVGVIPRALVEREHAHRGCNELLIVDTMHERKRLMAERADAFVALPGGIGTLEEFFEVWTWRQLEFHRKPVGLLNDQGYYDALLGFLRSAASTGFMSPEHMAQVDHDTDCAPLLSRLVHRGVNTQPSDLGII